MMSEVTHEIKVDIKNKFTSGLYYCEVCETETLHIKEFIFSRFRCVAAHGDMVECDSCNAYVTKIVKVVVTGPWEYQRLCKLCDAPDSPEKQEGIQTRRQQAIIDAGKPIDPNNPESVARKLGASSFREWK